MTTKVLSNKNIVESFSDILDSLSKKERNVIERRVWLFSDKETLQNIGSSFSPCITRERVRQIEESWIKKIWRIVKATLLTSIQETTNKYLLLHWGLISKEKITNILIKELKLEKIMEPSEVIYKDFSEEKLPISGIYTKGKAYIVSYLEYIGEGNLKLNGENSEAVWVSKDKAIELFRLGEPKKAEELVGYISMEA